MGSKIVRVINEMHVRLLVPANYRLRGPYPGRKRLEKGEKGWGKNMDDMDRGWYWIIDVLTDNLNISMEVSTRGINAAEGNQQR